MQQLYDKFFALSEAVSLIPFVQKTLEQAHRELEQLRDEVVLYKRIAQLQEEEGIRLRNAQQGTTDDLVSHKWCLYEERFCYWLNILTEKGIQVRDFKKGLIDFPYKAKDGSEYMLCWQLGEEGLFYFHSPTEGFAGRKPTSLLPE